MHTNRLLIIADDIDQLPIAGENTAEPVYGAPARWIAETSRQEAVSLGLTPIEAPEVISTHLLETIKENFGQLVTRRAVQRIFDEYSNTSDHERAAKNARLIEEFVPDKAPIEFVRSVFRLLLEEQVSIRNIPLILEAIADGRENFVSAEDVAEYVRQRIALHIVNALKQDDGSLPLIQIDLAWEDTFRHHEVTNATNQTDIALPPAEFNRLTSSVYEQIRKAAEKNITPAIVTTAQRRRFVRTVLKAKKIRNPVLSYEELGTTAQPVLIGVAA